MRVESTADAPITTTLASTWCSLPVTRSKYCTPFARPLSSTRTRATTAFDRSLQLAGLDGARQQVIGRAERRADVAARAAVAAVVTGRIAVAAACVRLARRPATIGMSIVANAFFSSRSLQRMRRRRHEELAARQRVRVVVAAVDADQLIDLVVVRRDVLVFDGPGDLPAVLRGALEVEIGVAQADASPDVGLAAVSPHANQLEGLALRREVRLLLRVEEELRLLLAARLPLARFPWRTCVQYLLRSNFVPASSSTTLMPWRVRFQAAIPPEAPLPTTTTG